MFDRSLLCTFDSSTVKKRLTGIVKHNNFNKKQLSARKLIGQLEIVKIFLFLLQNEPFCSFDDANFILCSYRIFC
jgi:hypothetical protein